VATVGTLDRGAEGRVGVRQLARGPGVVRRRRFPVLPDFLLVAAAAAALAVEVEDDAVLGSILQNFISGENFSDKFPNPQTVDRFPPKKQQIHVGNVDNNLGF
jgi:hypothetical protein